MVSRDTSILAPLFERDATSAVGEVFIGSLPDRVPTVSDFGLPIDLGPPTP